MVGRVSLPPGPRGDHVAAAGSLPIPGERLWDSLDRLMPEGTLELAASADGRGEVDPLIGVREGVLGEGRGDEGPDQDLGPTHVDQAGLKLGAYRVPREPLRAVIDRRSDHLRQLLADSMRSVGKDHLNETAPALVELVISQSL